MPGLDTSMYTQAQPNALFGTAQNALTVQNQTLGNQLLSTQGQDAQLDLISKKQGVWNNMVSSLLADPQVNYQKVMQTGQQGVSLGFFGPDILQKEAAIFSPNDTPEQIQQKLQVIATRGVSALDNLNRNIGQATSINTGANTVAGQMNARGQFTPATTVQNDMGPSDANAMVTVTMPDGSSRQMTKAQSVQMFGGGNQLTSAPADGSMPQGSNALMGANSGAAPAPAPTLPGIGAPSPQQQKMFDASGAQYQAAKENDANYTANLIPLQKMIELLPQAMTGQGADTVTNLAKVAQTFGINIPGTATQAEAYSELEKYASVLARSSGAAPNSDAQLLASMSSNPNVTMNNAAAQDVAKTMLALQRMQHATIASAQAKGISPETYSDFARQMGAQQDPRAFGVDLMSPTGKQALLKELQANPAAKAKFINSLKTAAQAGVLGEPGSGQ